MNEDELVAILLKYAEERGYRWALVTKGVPRIQYDKKVIVIKPQDVVLYHVLHEVAHLLLGAPDDTSEASARSEVLAESISIVVRRILGFAPHPGDVAYIDGWLDTLGLSREEFFTEYGQLVATHARTIALRIKIIS